MEITATKTLSQAEIQYRNANRYSNKYSWKVRTDFKMAQQAEDFLREKGIFLPDSVMDFNNKIDQVLIDQETGECLPEYEELARMIYSLRKCNKGIYAIFQNPNQAKQRATFIAAWHSTHRFSFVWNWKKSKLIRSKFRSYLVETQIHEKFQPMHMVLTVPHKNGVWNGKRFYAQDLIKAFNTMRKDADWKKYFHGGEYGVEVKKTKEANGLHIHIHSLCFMHKRFKRNEVYQYLQLRWKELTGADFLHFETLYVHNRDHEGKYIMQAKNIDSLFNDEIQLVRKKFYLDDTCEWFRLLNEEQRLNAYVSGVMECIKYHFKPDCCEMANGEFDIELISEILQHSKGLRFHAKFGALYGDKRLCYNSSAETVEEETIEAIEILHQDTIENIMPENEEDETTEEEIILGNADNALKGLINPYTMQPATPDEYTLVMAYPAKVNHIPATDLQNPNVPLLQKNDLYFPIAKGVDIKTIIGSMAKSKYHLIFDPDIYLNYRRAILEKLDY